MKFLSPSAGRAATNSNLWMLTVLVSTSTLAFALAHPYTNQHRHRDVHQHQQQHEQRDPRLLPHYGHPGPEYANGDSPVLSVDESQPSLEIVKHDLVNPALIPPNPELSEIPPLDELASGGVSHAESQGIRLLHPLRVFWDGDGDVGAEVDEADCDDVDEEDEDCDEEDEHEGEDCDDGENDEDCDQEDEGASGPVDGMVDGMVNGMVEDNNDDGDDLPNPPQSHGHWPDYNPTATSADNDDDEADPGEGGDMSMTLLKRNKGWSEDDCEGEGEGEGARRNGHPRPYFQQHGPGRESKRSPTLQLRVKGKSQPASR